MADEITAKERHANDSKFINGLRESLRDVLMYQDRKYSPDIVALAMGFSHLVDARVKAIETGMEIVNPPPKDAA